MKQLDHTTLTRLTAWLEQEDDFVFLETSRPSAEDHRSLLLCHPRQWLVCTAKDDARTFLDRADDLRSKGYCLAGWFAYEFAGLLEPRLHALLAGKQADPDQPLAVLGVFDSALIYDHRQGSFSGGSGWPGIEGEKGESHCSAIQPSMSRQDYLQALEQIKKYLRAGDSYQVNFTLHLDFRFQGSMGALYRRLRRAQSVAYSAWIRCRDRDILSFSPELFFRADPGRVRVRPMKGTLARGRTTAEDESLARQLARDGKNRSENVMIVDLLRNDLGRLLHDNGGGEVQVRSLFDVERYESLHQMTSTVDGIIAGDETLPLARLIPALFPCGSVTGAPKIRTMEIIHELEQGPRGVYCGAIGYADPQSGCFNVPIRTLEISGSRGRMGIGSGITVGSDPEAEWEECLLKGNFLTRNTPEFQLIETLLWTPEKGFFLLDLHLGRLADSARYFAFAYDETRVRWSLERAVIKCGTRQRVRLLLFREGGVEVTGTVLSDADDPGTMKMVVLSREQVDEQDPFYFHKTTRRHLFDSEFHKWTARGCVDVLFTNSYGLLTEGAISNIFVRRQKDGQLLTPPLRCGLLAGTLRQHLLDSGRAREELLLPRDLYSAAEIYIGNSVRGLVRVQLLEDENG